MWTLEGTKPWCSLAGSLSHALVTAHTTAGHRRLFAIALRNPTVEVVRGTWVSRGLPSVDSGPIEVHGAAAEPIGADQWYLERSGFGWGGAVSQRAGTGEPWDWRGRCGSRSRRASLDQIAQMHLGAIDLALHACRQVLWSAAASIDGGDAAGGRGAILAGRVRGVVAAAAEQVLIRIGHVLGPAPLTQDELHARRVADLTIYLRQHHGERDDAALGRALRDGEQPW